MMNTKKQCDFCEGEIEKGSLNDDICNSCAEAIADDWEQEMLGDDYYLLQGHDIGDK